MESKTALTKYIFLDIVKYSVGRTVEAQTEIISKLNEIVKSSVTELILEEEKVIYLPTGDGICICLINRIEPYDIHLQIALLILEKLFHHNQKEDAIKRRFCVRIGINENYDNLITDINGKENVAGSGINDAQRIMAMAEENQIFVGQSVYEKLVQRELYYNSFINIPTTNKHGIPFIGYRFYNKDFEYLNNEDITPKKKADENIPRDIAIYHSLLKIFNKKIIELSTSPGDSYVIFNIMIYIFQDILEYESEEEIEQKTWKSKLFDYELSNIETAFENLNKSYFWFSCDAARYYISKYEIGKWRKYFTPNYLAINKDYENGMQRQWPDIFKDVISILLKMYPKWFNLEDFTQ